MKTKKILLVAGTRPNFMKVAPLIAALGQIPRFVTILMHTGQHFSPEMSEIFFRDLGLPAPSINLGVSGGSHAEQTGQIMVGFERAAAELRPDLVVVVGDVNSTLACGLAAKKLNLPLAHVEAGLRSGDRSMPEEINRIAVDAISDFFFTTEASGNQNLRREGISPERIHFVGNVMIDSLKMGLARCNSSTILEQYRLSARNYVVVTLHRASNVDDVAKLGALARALDYVAGDMPVLFPVHPRTQAGLRQIAPELSRQVHCIAPLGYIDMLRAQRDAAAVFTDSGGVQEETTVLGVPCFTVRDNTERPVTLELGTNRLIGGNPEAIKRTWESVRSCISDFSSTAIPPLWDGHAADRISAVLDSLLADGAGLGGR